MSTSESGSVGSAVVERTPYIAILAKSDKARGISEIDFINQFKSTYHTIARKAYRDAPGGGK